MKINANLIRVGNVLNHKDRMMEVLNTSTIKPGKGGAYIQVEMKDMKTGTKLMKDGELLIALKKFLLMKLM